MKKNSKFFIIRCLFFLGAVILCGGFLSCKKKKTFDELLKEQETAIKSIEKKANKALCLKVAKVVLRNHFSQVDTVILNKKSETKVWNRGNLSVKKQTIPSYYAYVIADGEVQGTVNNKKGNYSYSIRSEISEDRIDEFNPLVDKYEISVNDKEGYYVVYKGRDYKGIEDANEELKKGRAAAAERHKRDIVIDGITLEYYGEEGSSFVYSSKKELTPKQIVRAIKKIGSNWVNMIQFQEGGDHYADYVYSTHCIIYKNTGKIYKVINGSPVEV